MKETIPIDLFRIRCSVFFTQFPNTSNLSNKSSRCSVEKIPCNFDLWQIYIYYFFFFKYIQIARALCLRLFFTGSIINTFPYALKSISFKVFFTVSSHDAFFFFSFSFIHLSIFHLTIARYILENFRGAPMYRQNKVIERENRAQQIYSMRNICVRMCTCLYIYISRAIEIQKQRIIV